MKTFLCFSILSVDLQENAFFLSFLISSVLRDISDSLLFPFLYWGLALVEGGLFRKRDKGKLLSFKNNYLITLWLCLNLSLRPHHAKCDAEQ